MEDWNSTYADVTDEYLELNLRLHYMVEDFVELIQEISQNEQ